MFLKLVSFGFSLNSKNFREHVYSGLPKKMLIQAQRNHSQNL